MLCLKQNTNIKKNAHFIYVYMLMYSCGNYSKALLCKVSTCGGRSSGQLTQLLWKLPLFLHLNVAVHIGSISVAIAYGAMGNYSESGFKTLASLSKNAAALMFCSQFCVCLCVRNRTTLEIRIALKSIKKEALYITAM